MAPPLTDTRVLDLSSGAVGGIATMVLADFGAEVVKVEPVGGDPWRSLAAAPMWLRGKRSVELDVVADRGRLDDLIREADVVVSTDSPAQAQARKLEYSDIRALNESAVFCSITGFGSTGPYAEYPAYEGVVSAKSGRMMSFAGQRLREGPGFAAVPVGSHGASQGAVQGILAALIERQRCGRGQIVETSLLQGLMPFDLLLLLLTQLSEREPEVYPQLFSIGGGMPTLNYHPVMTRDGGWIQLGNLLEHLFYAFMDAADLTLLFAEEQWQGGQAEWTPEATEEMRDRILERMQEKTTDEWMEIFRAQGNVAAEPFTPTHDAVGNLDMAANGDTVTIEDPGLGPVKQIGPIAHLRETPADVSRPAPAVGEANGFSWTSRNGDVPMNTTPNGASPSGKPLDGFTVLEFATIIATPIGVSMLADLGARVIKVEPIGGDPFRGMGGGPLRGLLASKTNAAKESICIDLKSAEGQAIVAELIVNADAIVHNYRPGVPDRLGIGYETAKAIKPDIVWVSANGYGPDSPGARRPSAHPIPGAVIGGALFQAGSAMPPQGCETIEEIREASRQLMRANEANPDPNTGVLVASATLLGLYAQRRYGIGQEIYVNMLTANAYANSDDFLQYEGKTPRRQVDGELYGTAPWYRLYEASEGWVFFAALTDDEWSAFCQEAAPQLVDARVQDEDTLASALGEVFEQAPAEEWERRLTAVGVGCVQADSGNCGEFFSKDEHVLVNGFSPVANHRRMGDVRRWGPLTKMAGGRDDYGPGVLAGQETDEILAEVGRSSEDIERLRSEGVVWSEPVELA
ncbi:MAG: CoA transferase [Chloroflexi bacterium]|nr:CoA transferase [Chloroflexota bacterium]